MSEPLKLNLISSTLEEKKRKYETIIQKETEFKTVIDKYIKKCNMLKTVIDKNTKECNMLKTVIDKNTNEYNKLVATSKNLDIDIRVFELQKQILQKQELEHTSKKKKLNSEVNTVFSTESSMYGGRDRKQTKHFTFHEKGGTNPTPPPVGPKKKPSYHYEEVIPTTDVSAHISTAYLLNTPIASSSWSGLSPMAAVSSSGMLSATGTPSTTGTPSASGTPSVASVASAASTVNATGTTSATNSHFNKA